MIRLGVPFLGKNCSGNNRIFPGWSSNRLCPPSIPIGFPTGLLEALNFMWEKLNSAKAV